MSYHIDYSDSDDDNSNNSNNSSNEELFKTKERPLTPALLRSHEKKFENGLSIVHHNELIESFDHNEEEQEEQCSNDDNYLKNVKEQINSINNNMMLRDLSHNIEMLKQMHEDICERLDWVTQQTQIITDRFNDDRHQMKRDRRKDRAQDLFFSFMELIFFIVGIIYASVLFIVEMYYSVNFNFF